VDADKKLTIPGMIDLFQDCSTFQSEDLGVGLDYCKENGVFWVINSWQVEIDRMPSLCDEVTVFTFPTEFRGFIGKRCFGLKMGNDIIVRCHSIWSLLSMDNYKPVRMTEKMASSYVVEEALPMDKTIRKISIPDGGSINDPITIENIHLDFNHHVNNGKYVSLAFAYLPEDMTISRFRAEYRAQAFLGDKLYPKVAPCEGGGYVVSMENSEGSPYAVMEFK